MSGWGESGGGGVGTGAGSPEAAHGRRALDDHQAGPPDVDPPDRPGCLRGAFLLIVVLAAALAIVSLLGSVIIGPR